MFETCFMCGKMAIGKVQVGFINPNSTIIVQKEGNCCAYCKEDMIEKGKEQTYGATFGRFIYQEFV